MNRKKSLHWLKRCLQLVVVLSITGGFSFAADQTWTGRISSDMCKAAHYQMPHDCIMNCIKAGAKYVFVSKGQVREIQNQDFGDLAKNAGDTVKVTGALNAEGKVIVSKVEAVSTH